MASFSRLGIFKQSPLTVFLDIISKQESKLLQKFLNSSWSTIYWKIVQYYKLEHSKQCCEMEPQNITASHELNFQESLISTKSTGDVGMKHDNVGVSMILETTFGMPKYRRYAGNVFGWICYVCWPRQYKNKLARSDCLFQFTNLNYLPVIVN